MVLLRKALKGYTDMRIVKWKRVEKKDRELSLITSLKVKQNAGISTT